MPELQDVISDLAVTSRSAAELLIEYRDALDVTQRELATRTNERDTLREMLVDIREERDMAVDYARQLEAHIDQ